MADIRKILIIFVIAVLFAILVQSTIDAVYPSPEYDDFCGETKPRPVAVKVDMCPEFDYNEANECAENRGMIKYIYDVNGCPISYECDPCSKDYDSARDKYGFISFIISALLGIIAIIAGLWLPVEKNSLHEWIGTGFLLGGLFTLFIGTMRYYSDLHRILRPIIILIELLIVIYLSYKKLNPKKK